MSNLLDWIKEKMDLKSYQDRMDERFNNGVQVAAAPLAKGGELIGRRSYAKIRNGFNKANSSPRDIIRTNAQSFPYKIYSDEKNLLGNVKGPGYYETSAPEDYSLDNYILFTPEGEVNSVFHTGNHYPVKVADGGVYDQFGNFWPGTLKKNFSDEKLAFDKAYNEVRSMRESENQMLKGDPFEERKYKIENGFGPGNLKGQIKNDGKATEPIKSAFTLDDWKSYVDARKASKEAGQQLGKKFAEKGSEKYEKNRYAKITGVEPDRWVATLDGKWLGRPHTSKEEAERSAWYANNVHPIGTKKDPSSEYKVHFLPGNKKPTKALGGQNAQYLDTDLNEFHAQDIDDLEDAAKPIHYDRNGNPYVRGFTWTQTGNVPAITDPNSGYLATVGADAKEYHPDIAGHWTSEGWGNPMDKNYENHVRPGEVIYDRQAAEELLHDTKVTLKDRKKFNALKDGFINDKINLRTYRDGVFELARKYNIPYKKNFDEQLLETRWPLKFYNRAPQWHQTNNGEKVTIMGASPGSKDVHRPVMDVVYERTEAGKKLSSVNNAFNEKMNTLREELLDGKISNSEFQLEMAKAKNEAYRIRKAIDDEYGEDFEIDRKVEKPVGTKVDKIATPSSMITAHMEDNMPKGWSMHDRKNGGKTIAGFHPNKKWSDMNAEGFHDLVMNTNRELYDELVKRYIDEYGLDELAAEYGSDGVGSKKFMNYVGSMFMENPEYADILKQSMVDKVAREIQPPFKPNETLVHNARAQLAAEETGNTPYEISFMKDRVRPADKFSMGAVSRGLNKNTFTEEDAAPQNVMDVYEKAMARMTELQKKYKNQDDGIERFSSNGYSGDTAEGWSDEDSAELERLVKLTDQIERVYGW